MELGFIFLGVGLAIILVALASGAEPGGDPALHRENTTGLNVFVLKNSKCAVCGGDRIRPIMGKAACVDCLKERNHTGRAVFNMNGNVEEL
jgi:hypothetical protein